MVGAYIVRPPARQTSCPYVRRHRSYGPMRALRCGLDGRIPHPGARTSQRARPRFSDAAPGGRWIDSYEAKCLGEEGEDADARAHWHWGEGGRRDPGDWTPCPRPASGPDTASRPSRAPVSPLQAWVVPVRPRWGAAGEAAGTRGSRACTLALPFGHLASDRESMGCTKVGWRGRESGREAPSSCGVRPGAWLLAHEGCNAHCRLGLS